VLVEFPKGVMVRHLLHVTYMVWVGGVEKHRLDGLMKAWC
jgi:hypothetical protein